MAFVCDLYLACAASDLYQLERSLFTFCLSVFSSFGYWREIMRKKEGERQGEGGIEREGGKQREGGIEREGGR